MTNPIGPGNFFNPTASGNFYPPVVTTHSTASGSHFNATASGNFFNPTASGNFYPPASSTGSIGFTGPPALARNISTGSTLSTGPAQPPPLQRIATPAAVVPTSQVVTPSKQEQLYRTYSMPGQRVEFCLDETKQWIAGKVVGSEGANVVVDSGSNRYRFTIGDRRLRPFITSPVKKHDQPVSFEIGKKIDMKVGPQDPQWHPAQVREVLADGRKATIQFNLAGDQYQARIWESNCRPHAASLDPAPPLCRTISTPYRVVKQTTEVELNDRFPKVDD